MVDEKPLTNPIANNRALREEPKESKTGGAVLSAQFILNDIGLTRAQLIIAGKAAQIPIRAAISKAVRNEYGRSGLKKKTGSLLVQATTRFRVNVIVKSLAKIEVKVTWTPTIKYFFIHLFGGDIEPDDKEKGFLHFKIGNKWIRTKKVTIPKRNFLRFGKDTRDAVEVILERQIRAAAAGKLVKEKKVKRKVKAKRVARRRPEQRRLTPRGPAPVRAARRRARAEAEGRAVAEAKKIVEAASRRPTPFKIRKALRKSGLPAAEARRIVSRLTSVARTQLVSQAAVSELGSRLVTPKTQAITRSTIGFQLFLSGEQ